jgi:competence protein ComEC
MGAYATLTALGSPVWRATLMLALYLGARLFYREKSMLNAIGAAALALLVVNPQLLFGASFQLTFLCVWLVAAVAIPILERTTQPFLRGARHINSLSYDLVLPAKVVQFRLDLRMMPDDYTTLLESGFRYRRWQLVRACCWERRSCCWCRW